MRHFTAALCLVAVLIASASLVSAITARIEGPGVVWILTRGEGEALNELLRGSDARVLDIRGGGRLVQLYVSSMAKANWPAGSVWATLRLSPVFSLAGCG